MLSKDNENWGLTPFIAQQLQPPNSVFVVRSLQRCKALQTAAVRARTVKIHHAIAGDSPVMRQSDFDLLVKGLREPTNELERRIVRVARGRMQTDPHSEKADFPEYGFCVDCGKVIPDARMVANPQCIRCIPCQVNYENTHDTRPKANDNCFSGNPWSNDLKLY